jgi:hypothetical protein
MKQLLEQLGRAKAWAFLAECEDSWGVCEECVYESSRWNLGGFLLCRSCLASSVEYWERRGGFSSEFVFENACRMPAESSRVYRVAMGSYFATLGGK